MNKFLIELSSLSEEVGSEIQVKTKEQFNPIEYEPDNIEFEGPLDIDVSIERTNPGEVLVTGIVSGKVHLQCSRCLKFFALPVELEMKEVFSEHPDSEEMHKFTGQEVDLGPSIEEATLLALPMKPLCDEGCQGFCPNCGQNLNEGSCGCPQEVVDKRLAKLKDWFKTEEQKK